MTHSNKRASRLMMLTLSLLLALSTVLPFIGTKTVAAESNTPKLAIMGTSDIHAHMMPYDYMADAVNESIGLSKVYSVVEEMRAKYPNSILVDNGDIVQGSILGDLEATVDPQDNNIIIDVMNYMEYDAAAVGNHEYNFGLDFLDDIDAQSDFPWLSANTYNKNDDTHRYEPYTMVEQTIDGNDITIGIIGFVPPQVMTWDRLHLDGNVYVTEIVETAEKYIPQMKEEGADVIVVASHSGFDTSENASENASYQLSQVEGVDALITGHQHYVFPNDKEQFTNLSDSADFEKGTLNGVPTVMPGSWGSHLGLIELDLSFEDGKWTVENGHATAVVTADYDSHEAIENIVMDRHKQTIEYVNSPVGTTDRELNTFFARIFDNEVVQLVNDAQLEFATEHFAGTDLADLPLLSAAAPFRAGRGGLDYYTDVRDTIAIKDVADIYIYPNTLHVVKVDGTVLESWLEESARAFFQIDPSKTEAQELTDLNFREYNFDTIEGVEYMIDVTKPEGERIVDLTYNGEPVDPEQEYLVVTNNYRAFGGGDHLTADTEVVYSGTEENREVIIDYIRERGEISVEVTNNWSIAPFEAEGPITIRTAAEAPAYAERAEVEGVTFLETNAQGWSVFEFHPAAPVETEPPAEPVFTDINEETRGYEEMMALYEAGIISGYPNKTFGPDLSITRAEAASMLARAKGLDVENAPSAGYRDVRTESVFYPFINAATEAGIFTGTGFDRFSPDNRITRGETAAVLVRAFELTGSVDPKVTDIEDSIFQNDIKTLYANEITSGTSATTFGTKQNVTRRDFAILVYHSMNK
ncbi:5'-nucleotidase and SLH domain-containing protein [Alkalihalophilus pseudofirmus OF4]|uniref:5'-nucleotidase and SLH domain-containing protein n=1 Tax=Alkalihalophilus pseudofirmus (strain ATCC BAA-2126 / JCM 17055 / OF4) TaxID=398511 RepID=D3FZK5_ALKPO|nr:bifunctional 2',3'-cyclic-nucleotide 2'-phosphodiesterase/3'-nucleotidase [Alkalihalophilus pseudofirmus]ADC49247.1 5'-nucleotidase and SLH domain-containing protein [Alkalihalophilus pseudofirmus OF4]